MMDVMVSRLPILNNGHRPSGACWRCIIFGLEVRALSAALLPQPLQLSRF